MTLLQLRVLLAVVDQGGFTMAADEIGVSQPAVSRAIAALESELGAPLLARSRDGVALTEAGRRAVAHAREALRHLDELHTEVATVAGQITGTLRLASLPSATDTRVTPLVRTFADRFPHVRVRLLEGADAEVREWLAQGAIELGVVTLPAPGMQTGALGTDEMVAVLPTDHVLAARRAVGFDELAHEAFILPTGTCGRMIIAAARSAGVHLNVTLNARATSAILAMVEAGLGVSILPTLSLATDTDTVVSRPLRPRLPRRLAVALASAADTVPAARAFLDHVATSEPPAIPAPAAAMG